MNHSAKVIGIVITPHGGDCDGVARARAVREFSEVACGHTTRRYYLALNQQD